MIDLRDCQWPDCDCRYVEERMVVAVAQAAPTPSDLADRIELYLEDAPSDGGHSDRAGGNCWELLNEAMEELRGAAQASSGADGVAAYERGFRDGVFVGRGNCPVDQCQKRLLLAALREIAAMCPVTSDMTTAHAMAQIAEEAISECERCSPQ
jgi:hypothetical protein